MMRRQLQTLLRILDATPAEYLPARKPHNKQAGQSVVELALITPILIVLFAGLVEIGWFANNYLTLLDVTRAGARRGATLRDDLSPVTGFVNAGSYLPEFVIDDIYGGGSLVGRMPGGTVARSESRNACAPTTPSFYSEVVCTMITSMSPLSLNRQNGVDDIVVSAFSVDMVDPSLNNAPGSSQPFLGDNNPLNNPNLAQMVVVGRYPTNANECDVIEVGGTASLSPREPRDPFDFNENSRIDVIEDEDPPGEILNDDFAEIAGYDARGGTIQDAEKQVGFPWIGQHRIEGTYCIGSEWRMSDVERLFNLPNFTLTTDQRRFAPGQGIVMVEMFWQHDLLLKLPVFNPVFNLLGSRTTIEVWAAFPLNAAQPFIQFGT